MAWSEYLHRRAEELSSASSVGQVNKSCRTDKAQLNKAEESQIVKNAVKCLTPSLLKFNIVLSPVL